MAAEHAQTMKSVIWEGKPYHMSVKDVKRPRIIAKDDAVVRLTTAAICGTDLHTFHGIFGSAEPPWQMGHEGIGIVVEVGPGCTFVKVGDRVVIPDLPSPGHISVEPPSFADLQAFGFGPDFGNLGGCQSEYLRVPFADNSLIQVPKDGPRDIEYLFISDIWATAWTCLDFSGFEAGDTVAVFGAGPVGLLCAYSAILRGASRVYSIDHVKDRLEKAASIGAIPIDLTKGDPSEQILQREPEGVTRSCDCCGYECVNADLKRQENYILTEAINVTQFNGGIGVIGVYFTEQKSEGAPFANRFPNNLTLPIATLWTKNLTLRAGSVDPKPLAPKLVELVNTGRAKPGFIVSSEIGIEDAQEGYTRFSKHLETKVVFKFPWYNKEQQNGEAEARPTKRQRKMRY